MMEDHHASRALTKVTGEITQQSSDEHGNTQRLFEIQQAILPRLGNRWNIHQTVFLKRQSLSRLIYYYELYQKLVDVPGVICEFGIQWGATLAALVNLRGMLEPFNHSRLICGFDTFKGFLPVDTNGDHLTSPGDYSTTEDYYRILEEILQLQESGSPLPHIKKFELVPGDASQTIPPWLERNPHAIIAMAIFDMDVYKPTRDVLEAILPRLTRGSLLVFDELNCAHFPGETKAVQEVIGLNKLKLRRFPHQPFCAWAVFGE
jgi:hypothetical protein